MTDATIAVRDFTRTFALEDCTVRSDGDGRTVEAYAAAFNIGAEIRDQDGHYNEEIARGSFAKTISERGTGFGVFYNHAKTIYGTPDGALSVPIGVPLEVREDERGVYTATRYLDNPLADSVLDAIKQRAILGQSFGGRFVKSVRSKAVGRGALPTITRTEVAMREYGPTVFPAYGGAAILGTRSVDSFLEELKALEGDDLERFRQMLGLPTPPEPDETTGTSSEAALAEEPIVRDHSALQSKFRLAARVRQEGGLS